MFFLKIVRFDKYVPVIVLTLQQIVLSKNGYEFDPVAALVLTLQQIVLSKNKDNEQKDKNMVLTLQQIVLSKNSIDVGLFYTFI